MLITFDYADSGIPNLFLSDGDGRITGNDAIKFFSMSTLPRQDLKQVWVLFVFFLRFIGFWHFCSSALSFHVELYFENSG